MQVAIKVMELEDGVPATVLREVSILKSLEHKNVIKILDVWMTNSHVVIELEYMMYDLSKFLKTFECPLCVRKDIVRQIISGLCHCHQRQVAHRDLKPQNLLVEPDTGRVCLADFGMAKHQGVLALIQDKDVEIVTLWYRPPEVINRKAPYTYNIDMWSLGCILAEMILCRPLYPGQTEQEILHMIARTHKNKKKGLQAKFIGRGSSPEEINLILQLLEENPADRISALDAQQHPYFNE